ncbi:MAG: PEP-CTERM sorting domain-containing protein [Candidatus Tectimicrobiota bacterium]
MSTPRQWSVLSIACALLVFAWIGLAARPTLALPVYSHDFESAVGPEWSSTSTAVTPVGARRFLGPLSNGTTSLTLAGLPEHHQVTVSFDLFIIGSWDGNCWASDCSGTPDKWTLALESGPTLLTTTFSNSNSGDNPQAYPDAYGDGTHTYPARTGAEENNSLGYCTPSSNPQRPPVCRDAVYHLDFTFDHTASTLGLHFSALVATNGSETWGLDNVQVAVAMPEPTSWLLLATGLLAALLCRRFSPRRAL